MDIEIISAYNVESLVGLVMELWPDCVFEEEIEYYQSLIGSETEICYLLKDQAGYIAFIHASIRQEYVEGASQLPVAYLEAIYVKPKDQKKGIGKRLIHKVEDWAKEKGLTQIASDTGVNNMASIAFHEKTGFQEMERIVCFIKNL